jgi:hypothetical protein
MMVLSLPVGAEDSSPEPSTNFSLDPKAAQKNEALAREAPRDPILIRLVAIRVGWCDLIAKPIIDLDFAIDVFNAEPARSVQKRLEEEQTSKKETGA